MDQVVQVVSTGSNRVGKFLISYELLGNGRERLMLQALMGLCLVLSCDEHESGRGKEYIASSNLFQPLAEGDEIPQYRIEMTFDSAFDNPEYEASRINSGSFGFVAIRQHIIRVPTAAFSYTAPQPLH